MYEHYQLSYCYTPHWVPLGSDEWSLMTVVRNFSALHSTLLRR